MNIENEEKHVDDQIDAPFSDSNEPISSSSELEKEKRTTRDFYAQNNTGHIQVFIQSLESLNLGVHPKEDKSLEKSPPQTYDLHCQDDCSIFVERYKNSDYLAIAIVLSTFELVRLSDLPELKAILIEMLPAAEPTEAENTPAQMGSNPYISVNTFLSIIGGKRFVTDDSQQCIGLGDGSFQILQNFWELFPSLREPIAKWLIQLYQIYKFRTAFDAYQMSNAFVKIILLDFDDAKKRIFSRFYSSPNYTGLLGSIVCKLYETPTLRQDLNHMLLDWARSTSTWLWRPLCLAYSFLPPELRPNEIDVSIKKIITKRFAHITKSDSNFFAILLIQSEYFRTAFSQLLSHSFQKAMARNDRLTIAQIYLYLLRSCYYIVDSSHPELPLVACDTIVQLRSLSSVLTQVMSQFSLRKQLYAVLRAYLNEISYYHYSNQLFEHIAAYFYKIIQDIPEYRQDIQQFLSDCKNSIALRLCDKLFCNSRLSVLSS